MEGGREVKKESARVEMCVCVRERERGEKRGNEREREP